MLDQIQILSIFYLVKGVNDVLNWAQYIDVLKSITCTVDVRCFSLITLRLPDTNQLLTRSMKTTVGPSNKIKKVSLRDLSP